VFNILYCKTNLIDRSGCLTDGKENVLLNLERLPVGWFIKYVSFKSQDLFIKLPGFFNIRNDTGDARKFHSILSRNQDECPVPWRNSAMRFFYPA